jgi:DNA-binding NarL/FixJ family response regulator
MSLKILVADDHEAIRSALVELIAGHDSWRVCAQAETLPEVLAAVDLMKPDIVILDLSIAGDDPVEAVRQIRGASSETELLVFTMREAEEIFRRVIAAGVRGYVFKSDPAKEIEAAITALMKHKPYFTSRISTALIDSAVRAINEGKKDQPFLTPRERQIIQLVAEGFTNKQVAKALRVSEKTVETHRASLMRKLGINSIIELVRYAVRNNIIQP